MAKHIISVCVFCFLCATHSPCESHAAVSRGRVHDPKSRTALEESGNVIVNANSSREKLKTRNKIDVNYIISKHKRHTDDLNNNNLSKKDPISEYNVSSDNDKTYFNKTDSNSVNNLDDEKYLKKIFQMFGDGKTMTLDGFEKLMKHLDINMVLLTRINSTSRGTITTPQPRINNTAEQNVTCLNREELLATLTPRTPQTNVIDNNALQKACPALLYNMVIGGCIQEEATHMHLQEPAIPSQYNHLSIWFYSNLAVAIISACGVLGLAVIPIMQKRYYQPLLQFLVALAVGTLAGDALLHLLPHAMMGNGHAHDEHVRLHSHEMTDNHDDNMWKGFVAMLGLIFFFITEKFIILIAKWRKGKQLKEKLPSRLKVLKTEDTKQTANPGEKQCKHKYSSFPYCYDEIAMMEPPLEDHVFRLVNGQDANDTHNNTATTTLNEFGSDPDLKKSTMSNRLETNQNMTECPNELNSTACTEVNKMLPAEIEKDETDSVEYTVILREHENRHHGHSHTHGHVHAAPKNFSAVAWMVIMGDGLHNFTDGLAIGAAFSGGVAGGFSTAVAVFCHELPHELGDFAMLLKAGMSIRQALFYNLLSSVLCLFGNAFGVWLGKIEYANSWVFAAAAGMFLYIALVDMIPELSSGHEGEGSFLQCVLQLSGLLAGFGVMTLIARYENDLKSMFHDPL